MKTIRIICAAATGLFLCGGFANAVPINGEISFAGTYTPNNSDLTVATAIAFGTTITTTGTGDFAPVPLGTAVTMTSPLVFDPPTVPVIPFWVIAAFGFNFDLLTLTEVPGTTSSTLTLRGTGTVDGPGLLTPSSGEWVATFNTLGTTFSWSSSTATIPDGGATVLLLGAALVGIGALRRRLTA